MRVVAPVCEGCPDKWRYILYGSFAKRISCSIRIYGYKKGYESRVTPFCLAVAPNMGATKLEQEKDGTPFYADNYTYSLHIGIEVDSLFRQDKVFVRNRVDCFVGYAVIFVAVFTIAGAVVGKGNHQCVGTLLKKLQTNGATDCRYISMPSRAIPYRLSFYLSHSDSSGNG